MLYTSELKPNTFSPQWNFYADIQLIRGRIWLQLWTLKKFSEPRVSLNDCSEEVENGESWTYLLRGRHRVDTRVCAVRNVSCAVTYCVISPSTDLAFDEGVRCIFDWNSRSSRKRNEIGTDPVNTKYPVARVSQHQLTFLFLLRDADMHSAYLLRQRGWLVDCLTG